MQNAVLSLRNKDNLPHRKLFCSESAVSERRLAGLAVAQEEVLSGLRACRTSERVFLASVRRIVLPLPGGEGWGEGELRPDKPTPGQSQIHFIRTVNDTPPPHLLRPLSPRPDALPGGSGGEGTAATGPRELVALCCTRRALSSILAERAGKFLVGVTRCARKDSVHPRVVGDGARRSRRFAIGTAIVAWNSPTRWTSRRRSGLKPALQTAPTTSGCTRKDFLLPPISRDFMYRGRMLPKSRMRPTISHRAPSRPHLR